MLKIGLTGGIGAGKSYVGRIFSKLGIPVFIADIEARKIQLTDSDIIEKLINLLGNDIYLPNGDINRKKLANIIFNDKIARQQVNEIVHPAVRNKFNCWANKQTSPYVIQEAAIIFENQQEKNFDRIITVSAPIDERIERIINRDAIRREEVMQRIESQLPDKLKIEKSDFVIYTGTGQLIVPQIIEIHKKITQ
ncbi:MAG: dephospho-CoA kinase [Prolixibacteraceae bacterium]|nr:dephospho-CoA kinase [Prolixibacteraceae bacterium]MBN2650189.1 dephospho-CoA kinase [Prolixibacteraceae bacterium]